MFVTVTSPWDESLPILKEMKVKFPSLTYKRRGNLAIIRLPRIQIGKIKDATFYLPEELDASNLLLDGITERGGRHADHGEAIVVCDTKGNRLMPYRIVSNHPCGVHAVYSTTDAIFTAKAITTPSSNTRLTVKEFRLVREYETLVILKERKVWRGNRMIRGSSTLHNVVGAALDKAWCNDCTCLHYFA